MKQLQKGEKAGALCKTMTTRTLLLGLNKGCTHAVCVTTIVIQLLGFSKVVITTVTIPNRLSRPYSPQSLYVQSTYLSPRVPRRFLYVSLSVRP